MSRPETIARYLPYLRRYARALTGTQSSGDAYVVATLEALIATPPSPKDCDNPRLELFQSFTKIWNSLSINRRTGSADVLRSPEQRLANLTALPRQALLLMALEGFSEDDGAQILECDIPTLRQLVDESGRELAAEIATDVLIIEDETLIAINLTILVENLGHKVIGVARTHTEAVKLASTIRPGLVLADIQLADGSSGLEAANEILRSSDAPVIFITAYPQRFLTGERPEPSFLISKPFQPASVSAIASQALFFEHKARRPVARRLSA
jgi:CheY-like chemotaxis protein/DNA-directed RNA polymerase specialized sigma24 family protein